MNQFEFLQRFPARGRTQAYAIAGEPESFRDHVLNAIVTRHRPSDMDFTNVTTKSAAEAINLLSLSPVGTHRMVVLRDFSSWKDRFLLEEWLSRFVSPTIVPVFVSAEKSPDTKNNFVQYFVRKGWWVVCTRPTSDAMTEFVIAKYHLVKSVASLLVEYSGADLNRIHMMVYKLYHLTGGLPPLAEDVYAAVSGYTATIYVLVDLMIEGKRKQAAQLLESHISLGLLTLLQRRLRILLRAREMAINGTDYQSAASQLKMPLFLVPAVMEKSRGIAFERLARLSQVVAVADRDVTVRGCDLQTVLTRLLLEM